MSHKRAFLRTLIVTLCACALAAPLSAAGYADVAKLLKSDHRVRKEGMQALIASGDRRLVPWIVDALFFIPVRNRTEALKTLEALAGEKVGRGYRSWVEWVGKQQDLEPAAGYLRWKRDVLMLIDPRYQQIFYDGAGSTIRLEEIISGGVKLDGIPSLDDPVVIAAADASYLSQDEQVFGVDLGGAQRAYPLRMLGWHEMLNDTLGGRPITLSYCTLCGSGILYDTRTRSGEPYRFGTSGLLFRSNKLMYDRQTWSLWSNLTGQAVVGRSAVSGASLPMLAMTRTTWGAWQRQHPATTTLALEQPANAETHFDYRPGIAERARAGVSFPVWQKSKALRRDTEIYALVAAGRAKAYPLAAVLKARVINDQFGTRAIVLVAEPQTGAVRVYARGDHRFTAGAGDRSLRERDGGLWRITEQALVPPASATGDAADEPTLARMPGHLAYWFGWYAFYPHTEIYGQDGE